MDPLSIVALASATVQFVDFGLKTVHRCYEIYKSAEGLTADNAELKDHTRRLEEISVDLAHPQIITTPSGERHQRYQRIDQTRVER